MGGDEFQCSSIDYFPTEGYSPDPNDSTNAIPCKYGAETMHSHRLDGWKTVLLGWCGTNERCPYSAKVRLNARQIGPGRCWLNPKLGVCFNGLNLHRWRNYDKLEHEKRNEFSARKAKECLNCSKLIKDIPVT